jgi:hypothetical protein
MFMPFFEKPDPKPQRQQRRRLRRDDEYSRPTLFVPTYLPEDVVLGLSEEAAVVMHGVACYPRGFAFSLETTSRYEVSYDDEDEEDAHGPFRVWSGTRQPSAQFGIEYSDGRRATLAEGRRPLPREGRKDDITIWPGGGGSGGGHSTTDLWVRPLPPPGPVTFAVEWPSKGIDESLRQIDGRQFRDAAERATRVFPPRRA